jgi:hypothetical protein
MRSAGIAAKTGVTANTKKQTDDQHLGTDMTISSNNITLELGVLTTQPLTLTGDVWQRPTPQATQQQQEAQS